MATLFTGRQFLLTYSRYSIVDTELIRTQIQEEIDMFVDTWTNLYIACIEKHEDGTLHVHICIRLPNVLSTPDWSTFDIENHHPNIKVMGRTRTDHIRVVRYLKKEKDWWGTMDEEHHVSRDDAYTLAMHQQSRSEAESILRNEVPRDYFVSQRNIMLALERLYPVPPPPKELYSSPFQNFHLPPVIQHWMTHQFPIPGRKTALVLIGPSRLGKTCYARSINPNHNYFKGDFSLNYYDVTADYHVFDDINFKTFDMKGWIGPDDFIAKGKYLKDRLIKGGKPVIILCNEYPVLKGGRLTWWLDNTTRVYVRSKLY